MSILYLEIIEQKNIRSLDDTIQSVRIKVVNSKEAVEKLAIYEPDFKGKSYIKRLHVCNHDKGLPCTVEPL